MKSSILVCSVVVLTMCFALPTLAKNLQDGLVGYWAFDGNADDSSGNAYHAEENGDVAYAQQGRIDEALNLEATGAYLVVPNNVDTQLRSTEAYTVSIHLMANSIAHGDLLYHGLGCSTWASWFLGMEGAEPDAALNAGFLVFGVRSANGAAYVAAMSESETDSWVHIAVTYKDDVLTMYVDGVEAESSDIGILPYDSQEKLHIGGDPGCGGRSWYNGLIDDLRLYNRALTMDEIKSLAKGTLAVDLSGSLTTTWGKLKKK